MDYNKLEKTLKKYIHSIKYDEGTVEEYAKKLTNYIESIIEKEFRLVASGTVYKNDLYWTIGEKLSSLTFNELIIKKYNGKNISIYISEDR